MNKQRKMQKIVLINPPYFLGYSQPPIGLALMAAVLEREGYKVTVLDANTLTFNSIEILPYVANADVVGLTAMTPTINAAMRTARQLKQIKPDLVIVIGGPHATLLPEETLAAAPEIDIVVRGEGEKAFIDVLRALEHKESLDNVQEIIYYQKRFGIKEIAFYDDVFTLKKKRAYAIADQILKKELKVLWSCETRVDLVDGDLLYYMKKAGCYLVAYGIESASQKILNTLNKGVTPEQVEEAVRITREAGLQTLGYFMIGSPGESVKSICKTIDFAKKLKLDFAQFGITIPFPGTNLYELYLDSENGYTDIPWKYFDYEGFNKNIAPVFESNELRRADLQAWARRAYKQFYLRPSYFWQHLQQLKTVGDFRIALSGFSRLVRGITSKRKT